MPEQGRTHARISRGVINRDSWDQHLIGCCWRGCERQGVHYISAIVHDHAPHIGCGDMVDIYLCGDCGHGPAGHVEGGWQSRMGRCVCGGCSGWDAQLVDRRSAAKHTKFIFCSERHKTYWTHSHRPEVLDGNLPTGSKGLIH